MSRSLVILGSTGSIGRQTLDVVREFPEHLRVFGLATGSNASLLATQAAEFHPQMVALSRGIGNFSSVPEVLSGDGGMIEMVRRPEVDLVVVGTTGAAGLRPTLAALEAGKLVALANKETLVMAGAIIQRMLGDGRGTLVPIDSEHSAIWQCVQGESRMSIEKLVLTASGGALRGLSAKELESVTPAQALNHPTWSMGPKITIDSANLMNKGLEVIEARWLFDLPMERVEVILHDESIVHSLVTFVDGSTKAQLGVPNMRLPIQYALSHPERWSNVLPRLDLAATSSLAFGRIDLERYPALRLALEAGRAGGTYPTVLSASDEVAVAAFLHGDIRFTAIPHVIERTLARHNHCPLPELDDILESDRWARDAAAGIIAAL